jgi:hypothetical protein
MIAILALTDITELRRKIRNRPTTANPSVKAMGINLNHNAPWMKQTHANAPRGSAAARQTIPAMTFNVRMRAA